MDHQYFSNKFHDGKIKDRLLQVLNYDDPLLCVVSSHLILERMLEIWIVSYTGVPSLLDSTQINFSQKLKLCKNCQLPTEIVTAISKLNKLRNNLSHRLEKFDVEHTEIEELLGLVQKIPPGHTQENLLEFSIQSPNGMIKIKNATNNQKITFAALMILTSMLQSSNRMG